MSKDAAEHHKQAAEHLEQAAKRHLEAAKQHVEGEFEKAAHHDPFKGFRYPARAQQL
jgi:hypothetical protein